MQTNTATGRPAKKPKLADDNAIIDALPTNGISKELATVYSTSELVAEISANSPTTGTSATSEAAINRSYIDNTNTVDALESSNVADLPKSATHVDIEGGGIVSLSPRGDMFPMTHRDELNILDKYFEQSPIGSGPANDVEGLDKWLMCAAESIHQDDAVDPTAWSNTPGVLAAAQHPPVAGKNAVSSGASDIPDPDQLASAAMSESSSSVSSSGPGSLSTNLTSYPPSETHRIDQDSISGVLHTPYAKRPIIDESAQWLVHVLTALQAVDDTTRRPNSSVPGILNDILTEGDFTLCVKILTGIAENLVKCSCRIAKPTINLTQERS
jgi:hypothetical protein